MSGLVLIVYFLISLSGWLIGIVVAGGLGYGCARAARWLQATPAGAGRWATVWPWRTIVVALPLLAPFVPTLIGLGNRAWIVMTALFVFTLAWVFTVSTLFEHWYAPPLAVRFVRGARTLAVASPILAVASSIFGGGGLGTLIWQGTQPGPDYSALAAVVLVALLFDIAMGVLEVGLSQPGRRSPKAMPA